MDEGLKKSHMIAILDEAAYIAEKAYRRGFQQGVVFSEEHGISNEDAQKFRYDVPLDKAYGAPERDKESGNILNPFPCNDPELISLWWRHFIAETNPAESPIISFWAHTIQEEENTAKAGKGDDESDFSDPMTNIHP